MKKKALPILALLLIAVSNVFAIGFGYHVIEAETEMDFASGIFPVALDYQFNFPVPDIIDGSSTVFAFRLNNGLDFRTLKQNPETGEFYALNPEAVSHTLDYMVLYDEFNLFFSQGFADDLIQLEVSIDGRFENAYEALNFMYKGDTDGLFNVVTKNAGGTYSSADRFSSFSGAPELKGDRSVFQTYVSGRFVYDSIDDYIVKRDGMRFESYFRITGPWMPLNDKTGEFILSENTLTISRTLFSAPRSENRAWTSFVFDNETTYRLLLGAKVPYYIQGGEVWNEVASPATTHVITNSTSVTWYGPQITQDTYPSLSVFFNIGLSVGKALNSEDSKSYTELVAVYGLEAEIMIFDIAKLYWQWGFVTNPVFNEECRAISRIGFTLGV